MTIGTRFSVPPVSWNAVAWAPNEFPNSRIIAPRIAGDRIGSATCRQYWAGVAPMFSAASRHSRRSPSRAGAMISTMSGNWKYM
jgi:hypothetical protein